ncbi:cache domain-containing sensor histidine kinase [Alkaliphilus peptidifermentans]|uniref:histidine kinase n=1 Tax=Alkaliphilus peptidifermentans DSM 18978 TaxID=1120976 RepID=A0A1G5AV43_9FIRM|nr:sensor histidine kinase [Alkaliphilus peptidifermentans]SCX81726.1 two-component system, sensor histidine kinase YesM [Alkaliphilus peptidifermentans DSM 18978]
MKMFTGAYFYKLLIFFIIVGFIPLFIIGTFLYGFSSRELRNMIYEQTNSYVMQVHDNIDELLKDNERSIEALYEDEQIRQVLLGKLSKEEAYHDIYEKIYFLMAAKKNKSPVYILNTEGDLIFATHSLVEAYNLKIYSNWGIFRKAVEAEGETVFYGHNYLDSDQNSIVLSMGKAIFHEGVNIGYIIIDISRNAILDTLNTSQNAAPFNTILVDEHFYVMVNQKNPFEEGNFLNQTYQDYITDASKNAYWTTIDENPYLLLRDTSTKFNISTITLVPLDIIMKNDQFIKSIILWGCVISLIVCIVVALFLARNIANPINVLVKAMRDVEKGDLTVEVDFQRSDEIGVLGISFNRMVKRLRKLMSNIIEKQQRIRVSEVKLLQAQINPHFLYNSLDCIKWMAKLNQVEEVSTITTHLGKLLRNSINIGDEFTTVEECINLIKSYLYIQQIRVGDKLTTEMEIDNKILKEKIPKLILQPIVENAIIHGLEQKEEDGLVRILGYEEDQHIILQVIDNGKGMEKEDIKRINQPSLSEEHIGLYNVNKRLKLYYGSRNGIQIESNLNEGTIVTIRIPQK